MLRIALKLSKVMRSRKRKKSLNVR